MSGGFFDYPEDVGPERPVERLVFLPDRTEADWRILFDHTEARRFSAGDEVIGAGDIDRSLFLVTSGTLAASTASGEREFKTIEAPTVVGEVAFLDGGPRSVTLVAVTDGELERLSMDAFEQLAARHPQLGRAILLDLGRILAARLRLATDLLGA